ncbi:hypothetical protein [Ancylobacter sp.]|uniref:hypothetical protein n=1 Tax=Ancylobacter sp. TaxID=1872567 RepID=UPI003D0F8A91
MRHPYITTAFARLRRAVLGAAVALAAFGAIGLAAGPADAGVAMPSLSAPAAAADIAAPSAALTENVRWVCGPFRCFWRPNWNNWYVPPYARGWGPPLRPNCFWRRGWGGGWAHVCP